MRRRSFDKPPKLRPRSSRRSRCRSSLHFSPVLTAATVARQFSPTFEADDLVSLPNHHIYLRLMIGGGGLVGRRFSDSLLRISESPRDKSLRELFRPRKCLIFRG